MKRYFVLFGVVIVLMLFAARKESDKHVDIDKVEHGHIVHRQKKDTTLLRSTSNTTTASVQENYNSTKKINDIEEEMSKQILMVFDNILKGAWKSIDLTSYNKLTRGLTLTSKPLAEGHSAQLVKERQLYVALAKLPFVRNICEIGFNGGHSAGLWLLANPTASVTMFDIWTHPYTVPAEAFLRSPEAKQYGIVNGDKRLTIIKGSSHVTLKPYAVQNPKSCDIISVDGDHSHDGAVLDLRDVFPLARDEKTIILLDDTNCISSWCVDNAMKQVISEGYYEKLLGISEADRTRGVSLLKPIQQTQTNIEVIDEVLK